MTTQLDTEILFPSHLIPTLSGLRGEKWDVLVKRIASLPPDHPEVAAFTLMMVRLDGCVSCNPDLYKALRGCQECAQQTIRKIKEDDEHLMTVYQKSAQEVQTYRKSLSPTKPD